MLIENLGRGYIVWDAAAKIEFIKPGRDIVRCQFLLSDDMLEEIRQATSGGEKLLRWFDCPVTDSEDKIVAMVRKQVYVRKKNVVND